jgi:hypothetical protein
MTTQHVHAQQTCVKIKGIRELIHKVLEELEVCVVAGSTKDSVVTDSVQASQ